VEIQKRMQKYLGKRGGSLYHGLSLVSAAIKLSHLKDTITSQGLEVAKVYISKLEKDKSKAVIKIKKEPLFLEIKNQIINLKNIHPKLDETKKIILEHFEKNKNPRIMIFAEYRDTVEMLIKELNKIKKIRAVRFIGQTRIPSEKGMSQKEQKQTLNDFRNGIYNILISTSIGEEGIDIPITNLVLFYEPVPSAIRHIQRKGRTARDGLPGEVKILIMENSRDEAYYWSSVKKERQMYKHIYRLKKLIELKNEDNILLNHQTKIFEYL
jgi:Fanconi anemia group M protein